MTSMILPPQCVHVGALALIAATALVADRPPANAQNGAVTIVAVEKVMVARETPALLVNYRYDFGRATNVFIKGLGTVPARGEFEYLTLDSALEVRDAPGGALLLTVPLNPSVIVSAKPPLDRVPRDEEFPMAYRTETWRSRTSVQTRLNVVLRKYFSYMPHLGDGTTTVYVPTTFTPLAVDGLSPGITAQLALLFSFPHDERTDEYSVRVRSLVREGRALSDDLRPTSNPAILRAVDRFVESLLNELKAADTGRP